MVHRRWPALFSALLASFAAEVGAGPDKHIILVLDVVRNPGIASSATNIGVPAVWRIGSIV